MRVLYFARAREIAGTKIEEIDAEEIDPVGFGAAPARPAGGTGGLPVDGAAGEAPAPMVTDLLAALSARHGAEFEALVERSTIMVDDEVVPRDRLAVTPLGSEVAILPPVSGGDGPHEPHEPDGDHRRHDHVGHDGGGHHRGHDRAHDHLATNHDDHDTSGPPRPLTVAVLTISDRASVGTYDDRTGPALVELVQRHQGFDVVETRIVEDSRELIASTVVEWCDRGASGGGPVDLVVTNGGTGLSDRDVTPEALRSVLDVEAPGLGEVMRSAGLRITPLAALSRQLGGRRARTVVVAVPGSVGAATQSLEAVMEILPHLCALASEQPSPGVVT